MMTLYNSQSLRLVVVAIIIIVIKVINIKLKVESSTCPKRNLATNVYLFRT